MPQTHYYGKYRGTVANNVDPLGQGRIQVQAPSVLGAGRMSWAMPCVPFAGNQVGFHCIPPIGANVWVEFESGNPDYPIWSGCFWGAGECPALPTDGPFVKTLKTNLAEITIDERPGIGGVVIETTGLSSAPAKIEMNMQGLTLTHGGATITMNTLNVNVNNGALEVT